MSHKDLAYKELAAAICKQAVLDYESYISDAPMKGGGPQVTEYELMEFAKTQGLMHIDLVELYGIIKKKFKKEFKPYVTENAETIILDWKKATRRHNNYTEIKKATPHHCPLCGGALRPAPANSSWKQYIICTGCNLNAHIPNDVWEKYKPKGKKKK